jgi:hypothetical protein
VVFHLAKHLHHVQVPPRERPRPEAAANGHRAVQAVQIEGLAGALQAAVQDVRDGRDGVAARRAVRLFFFFFFLGQRRNKRERSVKQADGRVGSRCV